MSCAAQLIGSPDGRADRILSGCATGLVCIRPMECKEGLVQLPDRVSMFDEHPPLRLHVVFGLLEGAFLLCMILYFGTTKPVPDKLKGYFLRSRTAQPFIQSGREIISGWDGAAKQGKTTPARRN